MNKIEYEDLKNKINYHMNRYYNEDVSEISDYDYDQLMIELKNAEKEHPDWITLDSPSQKIGGTVKREAGVKVTHNVPMLSIEDVFDTKDVIDWVNKVHSIHPNCKFSVETKIDGLSMTLRYVKNPITNKLELSLAETRGDGLVGEDVTANALTIPDILETIDLDCDYLELRGEVYMAHEDFERFNDEQELLGKKTAANPRNLAAGTLRQLDTSITRKRGLKMFIFNIQDGPDKLMSLHTYGLDTIAAKGVSTVFHKCCFTAEEVVDTINEIGEMRSILPYDIDGAVVKIDETALRSEFGGGSKYSSGHIAYKYPPEERPVVIEQVEVTVGRTGKLGFIGHIYDAETGKAARLCGTNVTRVTLHNQDYINEMKIGIGGKYLLKKSGDIIPKLCGIVSEPETVFTTPCNCPVCGEKLVNEADTADIRCMNPSCPAQLVRTVSYFASINGMNIMGLGETLIESLVNEKFVKNYVDIYRLKNYRDELIKKRIIGKEKNTDKVLDSIEKSKRNSPVQLLTALGIRNVGKSTAKEIMKHYRSIQELMNATIEDLVSIPDIGDTTAQCIYEFFNNPLGKNSVEELDELGINLVMPEEIGESQKLAGLTFVITGDVHHYKNRGEFKAYVEKEGGAVTGSVSKKTNYLVNNDVESNSSKNNKAKKLEIPIISEEQFLKMFG